MGASSSPPASRGDRRSERHTVARSAAQQAAAEFLKSAEGSAAREEIVNGFSRQAVHDADKALYVEAQRDDGSWYAAATRRSDSVYGRAAFLPAGRRGFGLAEMEQISRQRSLGPQPPVGRTVVDNNELPLVDNPLFLPAAPRMYAARLREALCRFEIEQKFQMPCTWFDLLVLRRRAPKCAMPSVKRERRIRSMLGPASTSTSSPCRTRSRMPIPLRCRKLSRQRDVPSRSCAAQGICRRSLDPKRHDDGAAVGGRST